MSKNCKWCDREPTNDLRDGTHAWFCGKIPESFFKEKEEQWKKEDEIRDKYIEENKYVLLYDGTYYTSDDICAGKCPANGTLVNMGYRRRPGNKWVYDPSGSNTDE